MTLPFARRRGAAQPVPELRSRPHESPLFGDGFSEAFTISQNQVPRSPGATLNGVRSPCASRGSKVGDGVVVGTPGSAVEKRPGCPGFGGRALALGKAAHGVNPLLSYSALD